MPRWLAMMMTMTALLLAGCYHVPRGGVSPAPPGPVDVLHILFFNDYSRLCPERYDYCRAGKHSICCPSGACCDDGVAPYCCDSRGDDAPAPDPRDHAPGDAGPCGPRSTTCSRAGITICCAETEGCCTDADGLYCCAATDRDDRH
jgi:hypothetical protein